MFCLKLNPNHYVKKNPRIDNLVQKLAKYIHSILKH